MNYEELLKDPRWQRKRLEVMQADNFTCQACFRKDKTMNVHHKRYVHGVMPWEYDTRDLITLCDDCHKKHHNTEDKIKYFTIILENMVDNLKKVSCL